MKKILSLVLMCPFFAYGHGKIDLIECFSKDNQKVLRGTPKKNKFKFEYFESNASTKSYQNVEINLEDTVENKKLIENMTFSLGKKETKQKVHIKVLETSTREVRSGKLQTALFDLKEKADCYVVY